ncbi:hypothetical protein [Muriicola sp.]|uniref:hypothetical protein n=1 Tax=Muriicola sp. TaxID=2020856 RepID=UPI003C7939D6
MQWLEHLFRFYVKASIHVAFAVIAFMFLTVQFLNISLEINLLYFIFFGTIPAYNIIKYGVEGEKYLFRRNAAQRSTQLVSLLGLLIALYFGLQLSLNTWKGILVLGMLAACYALPVFPKRKNLRNIGILKILIVGLVWSGTSVLLPVLEVQGKLSLDVWIELIQRCMTILVLMIPFEIRDLNYDPEELHTVPQRYGTRKTRIAGILISVICFLLTFMKDELSVFEISMKALILITMVLLMLFLPKVQSRYFSSFWVEGFPIFWAMVVRSSSDLF